jgi:hypothetical protein
MHVHGFGICLDNNNTTIKPKFRYGLKPEDRRHKQRHNNTLGGTTIRMFFLLTYNYFCSFSSVCNAC